MGLEDTLKHSNLRLERFLKKYNRFFILVLILQFLLSVCHLLNLNFYLSTFSFVLPFVLVGVILFYFYDLFHFYHHIEKLKVDSRLSRSVSMMLISLVGCFILSAVNQKMASSYTVNLVSTDEKVFHHFFEKEYIGKGEHKLISSFISVEKNCTTTEYNLSKIKSFSFSRRSHLVDLSISESVVKGNGDIIQPHAYKFKPANSSSFKFSESQIFSNFSTGSKTKELFLNLRGITNTKVNIQLYKWIGCTKTLVKSVTEDINNKNMTVIRLDSFTPISAFKRYSIEIDGISNQQITLNPAWIK
ncbi:MAG: hypothetical protein ACI9QD_001079 [Thermoproteota archaeon]|jgi:hypothetical protein